MRQQLTKKRLSGFTLIEMLVVISIIAIAMTAFTFVVIRFMESHGLRGNGRVFESVFNQARQLAVSKGETHFVIIRNDTENSPPQFLIVQDLNADGVPRGYNREPNQTAGEDLLVGEYEVSDLIEVALGDDTVENQEAAGPLVQGDDGNGEYWIRFGPDGTITGGSFAPRDPRIAYRLNRTWRGTNQPPNLSNRRYDFLMTRKSGEKLFFDWEPAVGKIVSTYYLP